MIDCIIDIFCKRRNVNSKVVYSDLVVYDSRICDTRYMIWMYLHENLGMSSSVLAKMFHRNRPSIFRGIRLIRHRLLFDNVLSREYNDASKMIEECLSQQHSSIPKDNMEE